MNTSTLFRKKSIAQVLHESEHGHGEQHQPGSLHKSLGVRDLTMMGIAAIVGAGIFSTIGKASFNGGPAIIFLFIFVAIACAFCAVCYAEFASLAPVSGSAYTYSYIAFGELIAWIIGWNLLMEYAIGNIAVAISWSDYFTSLLEGLGIHLPAYLTMDYWTAKEQGSLQLASELGKYVSVENWNTGLLPLLHNSTVQLPQLNINDVNTGLRPEAVAAWQNAPSLGSGFKLICDIPAFLITVIITAIIYIGIQESKRMTNIMVILKMAIIAVVILAGCFYVKPENWQPFMPNGLSGVFSGTAAVFFSYIGFDAISTTAEECKNPQKDLPKAMFNSLIICTVLYIVITLVLTGMVSYTRLDVGDPLAFVFKVVEMDWLSGIISVSAVIATASVLLVFQLGQPRIWMSMSRDGLLPKVFARIHPKYKTPSFSTVLTGVIVGVSALFLNLDVVISLTSIGTLFAFLLVCAGILKLQEDNKQELRDGKPAILNSKFKTPYINSKWIVPLLFILTLLCIACYNDGGLYSFFLPAPDELFVWKSLSPKIPYIGFGIVFLIISIYSFLRQYSLIPVMGILCCSYLLCESGVSNWEGFLVWLLAGLVLYFLYGRKHSRLARKATI